MTFLEFIIGEDDVDRRIDRVMRKYLKALPLSMVYKNIRSGFIRINSSKIKIDYRVKKGDIVYIEKNLHSCSQKGAKTFKDSITPNIYIETIFKNEHIKIINKPYGMNVQSAHKEDVSLDTIIKSDFLHNQDRGLQKESLSFLPGPLHRLDKNTTGLLAFSQSLKGAQYFSRAIASRRITKIYLCILCGKLEEDCVWEHDVSKLSERERSGFTRVKVESSDKANNNAKTFVYPLHHSTFDGDDITIAKIIIETGRTHQIRAQASCSNYPLLGDNAYGYSGRQTEFFLHAWQLNFPQDNSIGLPQNLIANLPINFKEFISQHLPNFIISAYN